MFTQIRLKRKPISWRSSPWPLAVVLGFWLGLGSATGLLAEEKKTVPPEVQRLQTFLDRLRSLEADFVQRQLDGEGDQPRESRGQFSAARPGRFRWDYTTPFEQLILSDGQKVWFYEPDLKQATHSSAGKLDKTPAGFLTSGKRLEETFTWEVVPGPDKDLPTVMLYPLQEGSLRAFAITLHPQKDEIKDFLVEDSLRHRSRFVFHNWRANPDIPAEKFRFVPPKGVDVIENNEMNAPK
ncbi:MAG: outer membrane lipoprotein chaperone LolA [Magnetococcales bacterium]|nr:outer membrane lipoprotein chaperone LolA [Magnetococcales bacterium]